MEITTARNSAIGIDTHTPVVSNKPGNIANMPSINTKVLRNETNAEILPFDTDVKNTDEKIFVPANKYPIEKIIKPVLASANASLDGSRKSETMNLLKIKQSDTKITELIATNLTDILNTVFVCALSSEPCAKPKIGATPAPKPMYIEFSKNCTCTITLTAAIPLSPLKLPMIMFITADTTAIARFVTISDDPFVQVCKIKPLCILGLTKCNVRFFFFEKNHKYTSAGIP